MAILDAHREASFRRRFSRRRNSGSSQTCEKIDDLGIPPGTPMGNATGVEGLCRHRRDVFTKARLIDANPATHRDLTEDVSVYTTVLDDFYSHAECRPLPFSFLLAQLNDREYKSGADLYKYARSGETSWGAFSGFDGIEKCYGADRKQ